MDAFFPLKGGSLEGYERFIAPKSNPDKFACVVCTYHKGNFEELPKETRQIILKQHFVQVIF
ncbi:MAG TPA: hypothetical protein VFK47_22090 [Ktedonobacteraceae bacterium]|nr:hypothetical protein [Ktedonobacteraceae bacterium]